MQRWVRLVDEMAYWVTSVHLEDNNLKIQNCDQISTIIIKKHKKNFRNTNLNICVDISEECAAYGIQQQ